jgi:hypothetical protein
MCFDFLGLKRYPDPRLHAVVSELVYGALPVAPRGTVEEEEKAETPTEDE